MKRSLFVKMIVSSLFAMIMICELSFAQDDSKPDALKIKVDEFTGERTKMTDWYYLNVKHNSGMLISIQEFNHKLLLILICDLEVGLVSENMKLIFKLRDNSLVTLYAALDSSYTLSGSTSTTGYILSKEDALKLRRGYVEKFRLFTTDGPYDEDVMSKNQNIFMRLIPLFD